jgi:regulation of enolase protein 1 (concanavalin A-like superfamily)
MGIAWFTLCAWGLVGSASAEITFTAVPPSTGVIHDEIGIGTSVGLNGYVVFGCDGPTPSGYVNASYDVKRLPSYVSVTAIAPRWGSAASSSTALIIDGTAHSTGQYQGGTVGLTFSEGVPSEFRLGVFVDNGSSISWDVRLSASTGATLVIPHRTYATKKNTFVFVEVTGAAAGDTITINNSGTVMGGVVFDAVSEGPDFTAPTVSVIQPQESATVSDVVTLTATASDDVGVVGVQFKVNGSNVGSEDTEAPYSIAWDSAQVANGTHVITAAARDAAGNAALSSPISVNVTNIVSQISFTAVEPSLGVQHDEIGTGTPAGKDGYVMFGCDGPAPPGYVNSSNDVVRLPSYASVTASSPRWGSQETVSTALTIDGVTHSTGVYQNGTVSITLSGAVPAQFRIGVLVDNGANISWDVRLSASTGASIVVPHRTYATKKNTFVFIDVVGAAPGNVITINNSGSLIGGLTFDALHAPSDVNLALLKPVQASSEASSESTAARAVDGSPATAWISGPATQQSFSVDLGQTYPIERVVVTWGDPYASEYWIEMSRDGSQWIAISHLEDGQGGIEDINDLAALERYVRVYAESGEISIVELEVYSHSVLPGDLDGDGLPDAWELLYGFDPQDSGDAELDLDGDGLTNLQEYLQGTAPDDYYNGEAPVLSIVSGNHQVGLPGSFTAEPLVLRVVRDGIPLANAPVTFATAEEARLAFSQLPPSQEDIFAEVTLWTDAQGLARIDEWDTLRALFALLPDAAGSVLTVQASAPGYPGATASFTLTPLEADEEEPSVPSNVSVVPLDETSVRISWDAAEDNVGVTGYLIYKDGHVVGQARDLAHVVGGLTPGEAHQYAVAAHDAWTNISSLSVAVDVATPVLLRAGTGLAGAYYNKIFFADHEDAALERVDAGLDAHWGYGSPAPEVKINRFSARWTGLLEPEKTGTYVFEITADDGVRLWVDGKEVLRAQRYGEAAVISGEVELRAGKLVPVVLEYFEYDYQAQLRFKWKPPGSAETGIVPATLLYPAAPFEDTIAPAKPSGIHATTAGDNSLHLAWNQPADNSGVASYRIHRDGVLVGNTLVPEWKDESLAPATEFSYQIEAVDFSGNSSGLSDAVLVETDSAILPEGWLHRDVGYPVTEGSVEYESTRYTVRGAGRSLYDMAAGNPDELHMAYREVEGDFMFTARVTSFTSPSAVNNAHQLTRAGSRAGVMIRSGFKGHETFFATTLGTDGSAQLFGRSTPDGEAWRPGATFLSTPGWVRVIRIGSVVMGAYSTDGVRWTTVDSLRIDLDQTCYVGLIACSSNPGALAEATFENVELTSSIDLGSVLNGVDSDGDGISDWEEAWFYKTDPGVADIGIGATVADLQGAAGAAGFGSWRIENGSLISQTVSARADYTVSVTEPGIYRLEVEVDVARNSSYSDVYPIALYVDGMLVQRFDVYLDGEEPGVLRAATPWLLPGTHTVGVYYENTFSFRYLQINSVKLQSLTGPDANSNNVPDWAETLLDSENGIETAAESLISPACVEGVGRYASLMQITVDGAPAETNPAPGYGWYMNVPLDEDTATPISASFESGGHVESRELTWRPLNILADATDYTDDALRIRPGDSVRLIAEPQWSLPPGLQTLVENKRAGTHPGGGPWNNPQDANYEQSRAWLYGTVTVTIERDGQAVATLQTLAAEPLPYQFDTPGTYLVIGTFNDSVAGNLNGSASMTIEVLQAQFSGDVTAGAYPPVQWDNPLIPAAALIEHDQGIHIVSQEALQDGGYRYTLGSTNTGESYVIARLGEEGPIADHATVHGIKVSSNDQTSVDVLDVYADGSYLVGVPLMLSRITPDTRVEIEIFVAGVTFEDGSIFKVLTAEDFDEFGRYYMKFIKSSTAPYSICHRIRVYEGSTFLGEF